ncbi:frizzled-4-like [Oppia nitens]|uniref:frizzled-4-like n=1 Tax=Oppia nitens TaxID=1686743 RepID=UPI0023D9D55B|nr:frizzled-4-like [Oppia nitens]
MTRRTAIASSVLTLLVFISTVHTMEVSATRKSGKCERITIPMCQDMPYNLTRMPNFMGHKDQSEAAIQVHEFIPLVEIGCSKNLKFFLCSLYAPMCTEQIDIPIPSCQSICEEVKSRCLPVLRQFNFNWPSMLNCSRLPVPKDGLCMEVPNINDTMKTPHKHPSIISSLSSSSSSSSSLPSNKPDIKAISEKETKELLNSIEKIYPFLFAGNQRREGSDSQSSPFMPSFKSSLPFEAFDISSYNLNGVDSNGYGKLSKNGNKCYAEFVYIPIAGKQHVNGSQAVCAPKCGKDILFTRNDKNFVEIWMCIWASICFISTLFTVLTFWIDSQRFRYPEKPIIFLSMCFCISSVAYLIRIYAGPEFVSCDRSDSGDDHITLEGLDNSACIIVFILIYYFGMAATMWWVCLIITWYLAASKKWAHEAIEAKSSVFHLLSWAIPAILTIIVITLRHVDGDELTGLCYVGHHDPSALLYFVIIPQSVFSIFAILVLIFGFISLTRIRSDLQYGGHNTNKLDRLMIRIGVFTTLYTVPALVVIGCHIYEYLKSNEWRETSLDRSRMCHDMNTMNACRLNESIPMKEVFVLKIFMSLVLGISTGIWVWSNKTWNSWTRFCQSTFGRRPRRNFKCPPVLPQTTTQYIPVQQQQHRHTPTSSISSQNNIPNNTNNINNNIANNPLSRHHVYYHSYASLKTQSQTRHSHRSHRSKHSRNTTTNASITHV